MTINFDRLRLAYNRFKTIPNKQVYLNLVMSELDSNNNHCGTIACGMGWLGVTPAFNEMGLVYSTTPRCYNGLCTSSGLEIDGTRVGFIKAATSIFNCDDETADYLFGGTKKARSTVDYKGWKRRALKGDKAELLRRIEVVFLAHDKEL